ncbi:MAG: autotransporter domain-containing protein [Verrucomicrobia bacterium]|nr:autotransporter domain-containing protein [Verrucomicrobiota bacterium]
MRTNYTILAAPVFGTNSLAFFTNGVISMGGGQLWNSGNGSLISNGLANGSLLYTNLSVMNHGVLTNMSFVTLNLTGRVLQATTSNVIFNGGNGIVTFNGGTGTITRLILTNASSGAFTFNSGSLITHGSIVSNGLPFIIGDGTNAAVLNLPSGTQTFANGLILSAHATLTNSTTLNTPTLTISGSSLFNMNGGLMVVNVVTNGGAFIQNGGIFDPAFYDNTGTFTLLSGTNQDTVFLNRASGTVNHSGGEHDVSVATNFGAWNISGSAVANLTNFINNGGTLTVSGSGVLNGAVTVGDTGSFNQLFITNGGRVLGDSIVILGNSATSSNNAALVTGPGSLWSNSGNLVVGFNGASNTLMIANGGQVVNASGIIGNNASASNNSVLVTGAGSVWNNSSDLYVGLNGSGNSLTITNGGQVFSAGGIIGNGASATYNNVKVTGAGSVWNNSSDLYVGNYGTSNNLVIANGGKVLNGYGYVGYDGSAGGGGNSVLVTGSGSLWSNAYDVIVGDAAGFGPPNSSGNSLTVTNSGMVLAGGDLYVGYYGSSNTLTIASGGKVLNSYGYVGYDGSYGGGGNSVLVAGPGSLWSNAYDVILGDYLGYGPPNSGGNSLTVTNGGVVLAGGNLYVGYYGSSNTLTIASGGVVMDNIGYVGLNGNLGGGGNSVLVTGSGSLWSNAADVVVGGYNGNGPPNSDRNSLTVTNGGMVLAGGDLYVGMYGSSNTLTISGGGRVFNGNGYIGYDGSFGGGNNSVLVTGSGSLWSNAYDVVVGDADGYGPPNSDRNSLTVTNGGVVLADGGLYVGKFGSSNTLTLANGGQIFSGNGYIGLNASASNNSVLVTGPGSVWSNGTSLFVGASGSGNSLTITNGGQVINPSGYIGLNASASNNSVLVTGPGSAWNNSSDLYVGFAGSSNNLTIANSGTVMATNAVIGNNPSTGNFITVSGGFLYATNGAGTGALDVRNGTLTLNSGTVTADLFYANNDTNSVVNLNGGTLSVGAATVSNSVPFLIGDGVSAAALSLRSGASSFANDLVVRNNATLTIFNTVNVGGNFTQNLGGTLVVGFGGSAPGQYGYLDIAGTASLTGMVQAVGFNGFTPTNGMQLTFLHAAGGWTNGFSSFTNLTTQTALTASLIYPDANDAAVKWNITFTPYALTPNQSAVANVLNMELNNPNMAPLVTYLSGLPTGQLPVAFDSLSPQALTAMSQMGAGMANTQAGNLLAHLGTVLGGGGGGFNGGFSLFDPSGVMDWVNQQPRFASMLPMEQELAMTKETLTSGIMRRSSDNPWGVWAEGAGQFVGVDANQNASGYHVTSAGLTVGLDRQVLDPTIYPHDQLVVGAALGYANSSSYLANNGRVGVNGAQGNVYGLWFKDGWHAEALGGGGANVYDTKRQVLGIDANGNTQGSDLQGMLGGGYDCRVGQWTFGPRASVQYTTVDIDGFTESGSLAPLTIGSQSFDSLLTQMGMHVSHPFAVEKTLWIPDLSLGWQHESMDSVTSVNAQFANGSGNIFSSQGVPLGRDSAVVGLGLTVQWSKNLATYVTYGTELMRNNYSVQNVSAGVRFSF